MSDSPVHIVPKSKRRCRAGRKVRERYERAIARKQAQLAVEVSVSISEKKEIRENVSESFEDLLESIEVLCGSEV